MNILYRSLNVTLPVKWAGFTPEVVYSLTSKVIYFNRKVVLSMTITAVIIGTDLSLQNATLCRKPITLTSEPYVLVPNPKTSSLFSIIKTEMTSNWKTRVGQGIAGPAMVRLSSTKIYTAIYSLACMLSHTCTVTQQSLCQQVLYGETISRPSDKTKKARTWFHLNHCNKKIEKIVGGKKKRIVFASKVSDGETLSVKRNFIELVNVFSCWKICLSCVIILRG